MSTIRKARCDEMKRLRNDGTERGGRLRRVAACLLFLALTAAGLSAQQPPRAAESVSPTAARTVSAVYSADFAAGEELFQLNKPAEAVPLFERVLQEPQPNPAAYVYLGVAYYQLEDYQKSLDVCMLGLSRADTDHKILAYNAGNSAYALANYARADVCYTTAVRADEHFAPAYLNRANARLKQDKLKDARDDYAHFLELDAETSQREAIERLLTLLDEELLRRANEQPELVVAEDVPLPVSEFYGEIIEESDAPALAEEPRRSSGELVDAMAPAVPPVPPRPDGERVEGAVPAIATSVRETPYGETVLTRDELSTPAVPKEQFIAPATPVSSVVGEAIPAADGAIPPLPEPPAAAHGEIVSEPALPAPATGGGQSDALEAVDGADGALPPSDYGE